MNDTFRQFVGSYERLKASACMGTPGKASLQISAMAVTKGLEPQISMVFAPFIDRTTSSAEARVASSVITVVIDSLSECGASSLAKHRVLPRVLYSNEKRPDWRE